MQKLWGLNTKFKMFWVVFHLFNFFPKLWNWTGDVWTSIQKGNDFFVNKSIGIQAPQEVNVIELWHRNSSVEDDVWQIGRQEINISRVCQPVVIAPKQRNRNADLGQIVLRRRSRVVDVQIGFRTAKIVAAKLSGIHFLKIM